jgi:aminoglycoside 2'-N-acetyltransferase I
VLVNFPFFTRNQCVWRASNRLPVGGITLFSRRPPAPVSCFLMDTVRRVASDDLHAEEVAALRDLFDAAWANKGSEFTEEDWSHTFGGVHFIVEREGRIVSHGSVIARELHTADHRLTTGYVEAVATLPSRQGRGHGSTVMHAIGEHIDRTFQLGALDTGIPGFYEPLGWSVWKGPTFVRIDSGSEKPTPDEDGSVLVRLTPTTPHLDPSAPLSCDWRSGDVW